MERRERMHPRQRWFVLLAVLGLIVVLLLAVGCGYEEGVEARATADELARQASDFAEGFCTGGTATSATVVLAALVFRARRA
jgi:Tfp pilus assembly protein PilX